MLALLLACTPPVVPTAPPAPAEATSAPSPAAPTTPSAPTPALITDAECEARGGHIETQDDRGVRDRADAPTGERVPYRVCRIPSPMNGHACRSDSDCGGARCMCTGALARPDPQRDAALLPLDGTPAEGACSDEALPSGSWFCLVSDGRVTLHGIIIN